VIELLIQAEQVLALGLLDDAERLYRLAADGDPNNAIAVVGLARVALERGDEQQALALAQQALAIDPESSTAARMCDRLEEVIAFRGEAGPTTPPATATAPPATASAPPVSPTMPPAGPTIPPASPTMPPASPTMPPASPTMPPASPTTPKPSPPRGLLRRLTRRS